MITVALELLKVWWKPVAIIALLLAFVGYIYHLNHTIDKQLLTIATLQQENDTIKQNNAVLEASVNANNQAIGKLAAGADLTQKAFATLSSNVKAQLTGLDSQLKRIANEQKPVTCEDTIRYLIDAVPEYPK